MSGAHKKREALTLAALVPQVLAVFGRRASVFDEAIVRRQAEEAFERGCLSGDVITAARRLVAQANERGPWEQVDPGRLLRESVIAAQERAS